MVTIPSITEIRDNILDDIESEIGQDIPLLPRAVFRVIALALAGVIHLLYRFGLWLYKQIFTQTMDDDAISLRASEFGISRDPGQYWIGTATVTGDDDAIIAAGDTFQKDGYVYQVQEAATISGGTATVTLKGLEVGDDTDLSISDTLEIITPKTGIDGTATIASVTQSGEDRESLSDFRNRVLYRQRNKPQGGAIADYVLWTTEVSGINEAFAFRPSPGYVNVYPLLDVDDPANRIPGATKLTEVEDYVSDPIRRPLNASVSAIAFTEVSFDVDIANLDPNTAAVKEAIETAIESYMYERRPTQYDDEPDPINVISEAEITRIAVNAGAQVATVDLKNAGGTSLTDYTLEDNELAVLGTLSWV